jgi:hypothetical protein
LDALREGSLGTAGSNEDARGSNRELSVFEPAFRGPSFFEIVVGRQLMGDESVADKPRT